MKLEIGDVIKIHCYKHNGMIYKTWDKAIVLDIKKDFIVLGNDKVLVTKKDGIQKSQQLCSFTKTGGLT